MTEINLYKYRIAGVQHIPGKGGNCTPSLLTGFSDSEAPSLLAISLIVKVVIYLFIECSYIYSLVQIKVKQIIIFPEDYKTLIRSVLTVITFKLALKNFNMSRN